MKLILDLFFPRKCVGCGDNGQEICEQCLRKIEVLKKQSCPQCNGKNTNGDFCNDFCKGGFWFDQLIVCSGYRKSPVLKKLIWLFKYRFSVEVVQRLGQLMKFQFAKFSHEQKFFVCPVPLSRSRQKERGFNQAQLLAHYLADSFSNLELADFLVRKWDFQHQAKLSRLERSRNVVGNFEVSSKFLPEVRGKSFLLVDDVATTCSTLNECAKVLKQAGANHVCCLVLARSNLGDKIKA